MTALKKINKGFTLIELLIVMAILGVLAVVVLVAINPAEQMARARDTGRVSGVRQIGSAAAAYFTANGQVASLDASGNWALALVNSKELTAIPAEITTNGTACPTNTENNTWCYEDDGVENFVVSAYLESEQRLNQCAGAQPIAIFSSFDARGGIVCGSYNVGAANTFIQ